AKIALSYALLGAFAMSVASTGLPQILANLLLARVKATKSKVSQFATAGAGGASTGSGVSAGGASDIDAAEDPAYAIVHTASLTAVTTTKYLIVAGLLAMATMSQTILPVHTASIPLIVPRLHTVFSQLGLARRLLAPGLTSGMVTTYLLA